MPMPPPAVPFDPDSLMWEFAGQRIVMLATVPAFVLQVMHPTIGAVIGRHSSFRTDPWGRADRSFTSAQTWVYGGERALDEGRRLRSMHRSLQVTEAGGRRHALAAEPWAWVALTAYYALVNASQHHLLRPLARHEREQLYQETLNLCRILRVSERMLPPTPAAYWAFFRRMIDDTLVDHPTAHEVITAMDHAPPPPWFPPILRRAWSPARNATAPVTRLVVIGLLPSAARAKLGLRWTFPEQCALDGLCRTLGGTTRHVPERFRYQSLAYRAREDARVRRRS